MYKFKKKILNNIIEKNDKILIAFSGGPDSVFLYYFLNSFKKEYSLEIALLYVNHNLRYDVENDIKFVNEFSKKNNVQLFIESVDVNKYSEKNKKSIELSARELRYEVLNKKLKELKFNKIATGHNLDDNVETFIFRLIRGTSIKGLKGIPVKRDNIIRPIINIEKKYILEYLNKNNENYIIDYTNNESDYTRNYIRNEIFPLFLNINPTFKEKIKNLIEEINENNENKNNSKFELIKLLEKNEVEINREKIDKIYNSFYEKNGEIKKEGTKEFNLGNNKILIKEYNKIFVKTIENEKENIKNINLKKNQSINWYNYEVGYYNNLEKLNEKLQNNNYILFKIEEDMFEKNFEIIIKKREEGDKIFINNFGYKKIKKILIDEKVSKIERDKIPIIQLIQEDKKEILVLGNIKYCKFVKKIKKEEIKEKERILIIRRLNGQ